MRRVAWDGWMSKGKVEERERGKGEKGRGRRLSGAGASGGNASRVFPRAAADPLSFCSRPAWISRRAPPTLQSANTRIRGTLEYAQTRPPRRRRPRASGRRFTTSGVTSQTPNLMPRKGAALSGRMGGRRRGGKSPRLLFFLLSILRSPSQHSTGHPHPFPSHLTLPRSHHNSSNTRSNGHRTRAR